jgi:predicted dehydrogenase
MEPVRMGLVGYGFGGRYFHAPLLASAAECAFLGVVTTSAQRREQVGREHPGAATFGSLRELRDAGAEAVAISTPADTHTALTDEALRLGLAVVCDKPFALDAAAARASVQLAEELGLPLAPYQNRRWDSDFRTVRSLVDGGRLGRITRFESRFERFAPEPGPPPAGGGTLRDFGSHLVDQALVLLGPVASVYAEWRIRETGEDDDVFVALTHQNGARSHLAGSWSEGAPGLRFRVTGTEGSYTVAGPMDGQEAALVAGRSPADLGTEWGAEPPERWGRFSRGEGGETVPTLPGRWNSFYPAFARAVRGEGAVPVDPRDAVATATVLDAARRSAIEGVTVRLS